ncbi:hypothetical protein TNCV_4113821 [Trichonephila clavipes]|nr:hypothetical protein TNCV_4113821 [Trichonephila clavipes]
MVRKNILHIIMQIAESVGISSDPCRWILTKDLNMHKVFQQMVPLLLNESEKAIQKEMAGDLISPVDKDPSLLDKTVTGNEKWFSF